jgi:hypothetical protein
VRAQRTRLRICVEENHEAIRSRHTRRARLDAAGVRTASRKHGRHLASQHCEIDNSGSIRNKKSTVNIAGDKATAIGFTRDDNTYISVFPHIIDGKPHPITGADFFDTETDIQLNPYTVGISRSKDGTVVQTGTAVINPTANTLTLTLIGARTGVGNVLLLEKQ